MALKSNPVLEWLRQMQLSQYEAALEKNGFNTLDKCSFLNERILDQIGISPSGHKKRILANLPTSGDYCYAKSIPPDLDDDIPQFHAPEPPVGSPPPTLPPKKDRRKQDSVLDEVRTCRTPSIPDKPTPKPRMTIMKKNFPEEPDRPVPLPRSKMAISETALNEVTPIKFINPVASANALTNTASNGKANSENNYCQTNSIHGSEGPSTQRAPSDKESVGKSYERSTSTLIRFDPFFVKSPDKIISTPSSTAITNAMKDEGIVNDSKNGSEPERVFTFDVKTNTPRHPPEKFTNMPPAGNVPMYEPLWALKSRQNQESGRDSATPPPAPASLLDTLHKQIDKSDYSPFNFEPPSYPPPPLPSEKAPPIPPRPVEIGKSSIKALDPFSGQDPFKDFGPVCDIFNQGSGSGLDEVEFDPFFQQGSTVPSGSNAIMQQGFYPETLNSVPPAQHPPSTGLQQKLFNSRKKKLNNA